MSSRQVIAGALAMTVALPGVGIRGSSHREAPGITKTPKVDGTDFYMFRSYEPGREAFVTLIANYYPLQDPFGGPIYFPLDENAVYEIHIDNNADATEDITFQFRPAMLYKDLAVPVGGMNVPVPVINIGPIGPGRNDTANLNREESYSLHVIRGDRRAGMAQAITAVDASASFKKPVDRIGDKSIPGYEAYASDHVYNINIPGCEAGRVFVGQRKDPFVVNLGEIFDLVNVSNPVGAENAEQDDLARKNVTSFILEVPASCLVGSQPIIGGWTTASLGVGAPGGGGAPGPDAAPCPSGQPAPPKPPDHPGLTWVPDQSCQGWVPNNHPGRRGGGNAPPAPSPAAGTQVSRLGAPLVNEVVIGLPDKDLFNSAHPTQDAALATYVTNPTLPELLEILFGAAGVRAPNNFPRQDLVAAFLTGIQGLNRPAGTIVPSEMLRLNTSIAPTPMGSQSRLGALGGDNAGFPNGRRPGDDVVDIELRVAMGALCHAFPGAFACGPADAPSGTLPFTDGAFLDASFFTMEFPYLRTPLRGSPNATPTP